MLTTEPPPAARSSGSVGAADPEDGGEVDGDGPVPFGVGDLFEPLAGRVDAGAVDHRVEPAEARRARRRPLRGPRPRRVRSASRKCSTRSAWRRRAPRPSSPSSPAPKTRGALGDKILGGRAADAGRRTGDEDAPAGELHGAALPSASAWRAACAAETERSTRSSPPSPRRNSSTRRPSATTRHAVAEADHLLELGGDDEQAPRPFRRARPRAGRSRRGSRRRRPWSARRAAAPAARASARGRTAASAGCRRRDARPRPAARRP